MMLKKKGMEESAQKNSDFYTEKTRDTIGKKQEDFRKIMDSSTAKFDLEKNQMKQKYQDQLTDITDTYQTSAKENNRFHDQSKNSMNERFNKTTGELQNDYNSKVNKLSENAETAIQNEKILDHDQRKELSTNFRNELQGLRGKTQEKNFKEVARLSEDNEKLRTNFVAEKDAANEQQAMRIDDILKVKKNESKLVQDNFNELGKRIAAKEAAEQESVSQARSKETKEMDHKFNEELKNIQRVSNQKISNKRDVEGVQEDLKRLKDVSENRIQSLDKNIREDKLALSEKENKNIIENKEKLAELKSKYNEEREVSERGRDQDKNKTVQKLNDRNVAAIERYKDESQLQIKVSDKQLDQSQQESKKRFKEQRVEFGKVVNNINEKNIENISTLKDSFAKDKTQIQVKNQIELSDEKRQLRDKLQQSLYERDTVSQVKIEDLKKETAKISENYEAKLEHLARQKDKEIEMLKVTNEERKLRSEQTSNLALAINKEDNQIEMKNLRSHYEKMIEKDRIVGQQQTGRIVQSYEDQLERERIAHAKELSLRTSEAQSQMERLFRGSEIEKDTIKTQYEDRIEQMKLSSFAQGSSKKA
jgi:hypothetical protein